MYSSPPVKSMLQIGVRDLLLKVISVKPRSSFPGQIYQMLFRALIALFQSTHLLDAKIGRTVAMGTVLNHPRSRGSLTLRSADPRDAPIISLNLLDAPEDMPRLVQALREQLKCWQSQVTRA
jgi:choline dehydrogenase-like flavoprotein